MEMDYDDDKGGVGEGGVGGGGEDGRRRGEGVKRGEFYGNLCSRSPAQP